MNTEQRAARRKADKDRTITRRTAREMKLAARQVGVR